MVPLLMVTSVPVRATIPYPFVEIIEPPFITMVLFFFSVTAFTFSASVLIVPPFISKFTESANATGHPFKASTCPPLMVTDPPQA